MKFKRLLREIPQTAAVILAILAFKSSFAAMYQVPTGSMIPTILPGDRLASNQLTFGLRIPFTDHALTTQTGPRRGDIVFFPSPVEPDTMLVKRVVAVAGDRLEVRNGRLILNGRAVPLKSLGNTPEGYELYSEFLASETQSHYVQFNDRFPHLRNVPEFEIPAGHFFPMGDNRDNSADGRAFGPVPITALKGRAFGIAFSLDTSTFPFFRTHRFFSHIE